ncbi:MAG: trypsin-like serine protease [Myxococcales bacterium]|nr:trypsin-like serine protease [Myxococcales bacterium]
MPARSLLVSLVLSLTALAGCGPAAAPPEESEPSNTTRDDIVGGSATSEFPAAGALTRWGSAHCTGTLVAARTVLTAAHCLEDVSAASLKFVIEPSLSSPKTVVAVTAISAHPAYDSAKIENDIGYVTLAADAPVAPIEILPEMDQSWVGQKLSFVGYGITSGHGGGAGVKRLVTMPISAVEATRFVYQTPGKNTCNGDSGGPAFANVGSEWFVAGVTSYGDAGCNYYGVDTRADAFAEFVLGKPAPSEGKPDSAPSDPCHGESYEGRCDGTTVVWCEAEKIHEIACQSCGFDAAKGFFNCL